MENFITMTKYNNSFFYVGVGQLSDCSHASLINFSHKLHTVEFAFLIRCFYEGM